MMPPPANEWTEATHCTYNVHYVVQCTYSSYVHLFLHFHRDTQWKIMSKHLKLCPPSLPLIVFAPTLQWWCTPPPPPPTPPMAIGHTHRAFLYENNGPIQPQMKERRSFACHTHSLVKKVKKWNIIFLPTSLSCLLFTSPTQAHGVLLPSKKLLRKFGNFWHGIIFTSYDFYYAKYKALYVERRKKFSMNKVWKSLYCR